MADSDFSTKACTRCREVKSTECFAANKQLKSGLRSQCRQCQAAVDKIKNDKRADPALRAIKAERAELIERGLCKCSECSGVFPVSEFPNLSKQGYRCRPCMSAQRQKWSVENRELDRQNWKRKAKNRVEEKQAYNKKYRQANREKLILAHREWYAENKDLFNKNNYEYQKLRLKNDPVYAMQKRVRRLISLKIQNAGFTKRSSTFEILGCDWDFFKLHIERQFTKGMTWENRGEWHLDHIIPISLAKSEDEVIRLNHFTNLRPMWARDNRSKGAQIQALL